jgi:DNA-binding Xre family transcriptional regulator
LLSATSEVTVGFVEKLSLYIFLCYFLLYSQIICLSLQRDLSQKRFREPSSPSNLIAKLVICDLIQIIFDLLLSHFNKTYVFMVGNLRNVHIGEAIEQKLKEKNISKQEFADKLGIPQQNLHRIFKKSSIDTDKLYTICQILDYNFFDDFSNRDESIMAGEQYSKIVQQHKTLLTETKTIKKKLDELQKIVRPDVFYEGMHKLLQLTKANGKNKAFSEEDMATVEKIVLELDEWGGVRDPELRSKFEEYERLFKLHEKNQDELERLELILEKYYELDSLLTQPKREGTIFPHL